MIHQGTLDERTTSETIRHNNLQLWLTERDGTSWSFDTTLWNYAARDSEKRHDLTQHLRTQAERTNESWMIRHNTHVFRKPSESLRKLVICHDLFPLSFLISHWIDYSPEERGLHPKVLHPHAYLVYQVTKWNLQWNVKSKSEILSYMKWLVARFTAYLCVCMHYKCSRHKNDWILHRSEKRWQIEEWEWIRDNNTVNATRGKFLWAKNQPSGDGSCAVM